MDSSGRAGPFIDLVWDCRSWQLMLSFSYTRVLGIGGSGDGVFVLRGSTARFERRVVRDCSRTCATFSVNYSGSYWTYFALKNMSINGSCAGSMISSGEITSVSRSPVFRLCVRRLNGLVCRIRVAVKLLQ